MAQERDLEIYKRTEEVVERPEKLAQDTPATPDGSTEEGKPELGERVAITMSFDTEKPTLDLKEDHWAKLNVGGGNGVEARAPSRSLQPSPDLRDRDLPPIPPSDYTRSEMGDSVGAGDLEDAPPPPIPQKDSPKAPTSSSSRGPSRATSTPTNIAVASSRNPVNGQSTFNSMVFVIQALETISTSKEGRRRKYLATACQEALDAIKAAAPQLPPDPAVVFEPLRMACETHNVQITTTALDTIGKLISYSYFSVVPVEAGTPPRTPTSAEGGVEAGKGGQQQQQPQKIPLIERAIETICECFQGDGTADQIQLQIIKALLAAVLNDKAVVHGAGLIKAIRQTYNIFLLSKSSPNQMTAQGTLTQMVHTVFERVKSRVAMKETHLRNSSKANMSSTTINISTPGGGEGDEALSTTGGDGEESAGGKAEASDEHQATPVEKITLQSFENRKSFDDGRIADTTTVTRSSSVTRSHTAHERSGHTDGTDSQAGSETEDEDEVFIKDAFVVFRSMCKLSDKSISADQMADIKSNGMRSKLLSLHLIHTILKSHMMVFTNPLVTIRSSSKNEPTRFIHAVKQYLCLSLSRNAASAAGLVFEVCSEIFWLVLREMRFMMKVCDTSGKPFGVFWERSSQVCRKKLRCF